MKWFRMYHEARTDDKLNFLSDAQFRIWFRLMCLANEQTPRGSIPTRSQRLMAVWVANGDVRLYQETLGILQELEIVEVENDLIHIVHWDQRQYDSDNSTKRWQKWNEQQKSNVEQTLVQQSSNVGQTLPQQEPNGDSTVPDNRITEKEIKEHVHPDGYTPEFESFWTEYPRHKEKQGAFKAWNARLKEKVSAIDMILAAMNYANECRQKKPEEKYIKLGKTFLGPSKPYEDYVNPQEDEDEPKTPKQYYRASAEESEEVGSVFDQLTGQSG